MNMIQSPRLRVVIMGGGFTGASLAWQLAEMHVQAIVTVVEPRAELGRGLAYSTTEPAHRINVPAHRMTMDPDRPQDFADWIAEGQAQGRLDHDASSLTAQGERFPRRELFGEYVADRIAPHLRAGRIRHIRARVGDIERAPDGALVLLLSDDSRIRADLLVLATGHPPPAVPKVLAGLTGAPELMADPYDPVRIAGIRRDARVLVLGAALGSADVIATLDGQGFEGSITCLSRHGLRSRSHGIVAQESTQDFTETPITSVAELLRRVRHAIVDDQARGQSWHATLSRLRTQGQQIWSGLDDRARARLLRHLRTYWDVHRYRLAPQMGAILDRLEDDGRLDYQAAHLISAEREWNGVRVTWRRRGGQDLVSGVFDQIVVTTGPAQGRCIDWNPALAALARLGMIAPDPLGLGLATTDTCRALDVRGQASERILVAGPLARGHVGELIGAPECAAHARSIAREIAKRAILAPILRHSGLSEGRAANPA